MLVLRNSKFNIGVDIRSANVVLTLRLSFANLSSIPQRPNRHMCGIALILQRVGLRSRGYGRDVAAPLAEGPLERCTSLDKITQSKHTFFLGYDLVSRAIHQHDCVGFNTMLI